MANAFQELRGAPSSSYPSAVDQPWLKEDQRSPVKEGREAEPGSGLLEAEEPESRFSAEI